MLLVRLFGHPTIERDGVSAPLRVPVKAVALLAVLAADHRRPISREWLAAKLWPDADPAEGRANLRRHVHLLGRALGEDVMLLARHTAQWNPGSGVSIDLVRFDELAQTQPVLAIQEYVGDLCTGVEDEALDALRARYRFAYESLLTQRIEHARAAGNDAELAVWLQHWVNHDPYDEGAVHEIMQMRIRNGDRTGALREFNAFAQRLRSELGTEPGSEITAFFTEIAGTSAEVRSPNNLPNSVTTFVGRERELSDVVTAIRTSRLVTLTGPGGIGKSRLAVRAAFDLLPDYPDGVWLISLELSRSEDSMWEQIASILRLHASAQPDRAVIEFLANAKALLLFDTCEHAIDDARAVADRLLATSSVHILATSRRKLNAAHEHGIEVEPLELPPEDPGGSPPMRFAAYRLFVERATAISPAFRVDGSDLRALRDVLRRTDGLPLAIELVASRANVLTIEGMRRRLPIAMRAVNRSPATARAQTIDRTIAWSYDLLAPEQQRVFRWLSTFEGTFGIDDVEELCGGCGEVAAALFELVDASLVSVTGGTGEAVYRLLDTTRTYARELLGSSDGGEALLRHAQLFANKWQAISNVTDDRLGELVPTVIAAMPDYLAALEFATRQNRVDLGLQILEAIHRFGVRRHFTVEMFRRAEALFEKSDPSNLSHYARIARLTSMLAQCADNYERAFSLGSVAVGLYEQIGDEARVCDALSSQAASMFYLGRHAESKALLLEVCERAKRAGATLVYLKSAARYGALIDDYEECVRFLVPVTEEMLEMGELRQAAGGFRNLAAGAFFSKRFVEAARWAERAAQCYEGTGDPAMRALLLTMRGCALQEAGETAAALRAHLDAIALCASFEQHIESVECLEDIGTTLANLGDSAAAARLIGHAAAGRSRLGIPLSGQQDSYYAPVRERLAQSLGARYHAERAAGAQLPASEIVAFAAMRLTNLMEAENRQQP